MGLVTMGGRRQAGWWQAAKASDFFDVPIGLMPENIRDRSISNLAALLNTVEIQCVRRW
jgi:hypothetical protein